MERLRASVGCVGAAMQGPRRSGIKVEGLGSYIKLAYQTGEATCDAHMHRPEASVCSSCFASPPSCPAGREKSLLNCCLQSRLVSVASLRGEGCILQVQDAVGLKIHTSDMRTRTCLWLPCTLQGTSASARGLQPEKKITHEIEIEPKSSLTSVRRRRR